APDVADRAGPIDPGQLDTLACADQTRRCALAAAVRGATGAASAARILERHRAAVEREIEPRGIRPHGECQPLLAPPSTPRCSSTVNSSQYWRNEQIRFSRNPATVTPLIVIRSPVGGTTASRSSRSPVCVIATRHSAHA